MSENEVLISGYTKPIKVSRPPLSSWRTLVKPVPRSWKPLDVEFLPVRDQDGALLDVPQEIGRRNPWNSIRFEEPPPPEPEPVLDAPKEVEPAGVGLKGKRFDWKWERQNLKPSQRTSCYTEKIRPPLAPAGHEPPADPTMADPEPAETAPAEEFPLMM